MYLFLDTETTGKANARICQIALLFTDNSLRTRGVIASYVKPDGWEVPASATSYHGITQTQCDLYGMPIRNLLKVFKFYAEHSLRIVAHNADHDRRAIENEMALTDLIPPQTPWYCTMKNSTDICKIVQLGRESHKWPKLAEAFNFFTGQKLENAHDALADTRACREVFRGIMRTQQTTNLELV